MQKAYCRESCILRGRVLFFISRNNVCLIIGKNLFDYGFLEAAGDSRVFSINVFF